MPFGLVFGAVVFSVLCLWFGVATLFGEGMPGRLVGLVLIVFGLSLSLGLLRRQSVARWTGVIASGFLAVVGAINVFEHGAVSDHVVMLASLTTLAFLVIPATGSVRRGVENVAATERSPRRSRALGWTALASLTLLMAVYGWTWLTQETTAAVITGGHHHQIDWLDYGSGLERARAKDRLMLVDFYADWCNPCKVMDRTTFRDARVVDALGGLVPVRIDAEETRDRHGYVGSRLAEKYQVAGYPTLMLMNAEGEVVARKYGAQTPRELLSWVDKALTAGATKKHLHGM